MPCIAIKGGNVCLGNPSENVRMTSGRVLRLQWGDYFGPAVETRTGLRRSLSNREFRDPNVDAWVVKHGGKSCLTGGRPASAPGTGRCAGGASCPSRRGGW
jgi:hypothetical protein